MTAPAPHKIVCHASGDKCLGCKHYRGEADVCEFTPAPQSEVQSATPLDATEQGYLEDNIATIAHHLRQDSARLSVDHVKSGKAGLIVEPGEVLREIARRLSGAAQAPTKPWTCCHCDADLSCSACGVEQPNDSAYYQGILEENRTLKVAQAAPDLHAWRFIKGDGQWSPWIVLPDAEAVAAFKDLMGHNLERGTHQLQSFAATSPVPSAEGK